MELKSQHAFTLYVKLAEPIDFGNTFNGDRRLIPIVGGHFEGSKLKGEILSGGGDWNAVRADGVVHLYARYSMRTHDGVTIVVTNEGFGRGTQEQMKAVFDGHAPSTPKDVETAKRHWYTKTWPRFEVQHGQYDWLNKTCFVGDLVLPTSPNAVQVDVYELL